ncbi:MAG TPA: hypothetical protein VE990_13505 [Acidimicrobiales bacterium]|nr:hypothetical protein [Acidimicrobiales bacterium]
MDNNETALYDDGRIVCDEDGMTIRWYYPWGSKKIPYGSIRAVKSFSLRPVRGKWRIWGSGDFVHWYNLDGDRPSKQTGIDIDTGRRVHPTITPQDPEAVARIVNEHIAA